MFKGPSEDASEDASEELMDDIKVSPGSSRETNEKGEENQEEHAYFKQPVNQDFCNVCKKSIDLISCDFCPKSYHLRCHDPPLKFKDIPRGKWRCGSCKYQKKEPKGLKKQLDEASVTRAPATKSLTKLTPLEVLIEAARFLDPTEFKLPIQTELPDMTAPRAEKFDDPELLRKIREQIDHAKMLKSSLPLPDRNCTKCQKSCKVATLIECDFCNSYFHSYCVEPPLTALPVGLWMCPLHGEDTLDPKILSSISCERVALRDKFVMPSDNDRENTVRIEVFRPKRRKNPAFKFKRRVSRRVIVPDRVHHSYVASDTVLRYINELLVIGEKKKFNKMKDETNKENEVENADIGVETISDVDKEGGEEEASIPCDTSDTGHIVNEVLTLPIPDKTANMRPWPTNINITNNACQVNKVANVNISCGTNGNSNKKYNRVNIREIKQIEEARNLLKKDNSIIRGIMDGSLINNAEQDLKKLDDRLIQILAYERLQQIVDPKLGVPKFPLASDLLTPADKECIWRIFASPDLSGSTKKVSGSTIKVSGSMIKARAMLCPIVSKHFYNVKTQEVDPADVRHDASFLGFRPTVSARFPEAIAMKSRSINVGSGSSNDVNLEKFGHCNFIESLHATIFFDGFENCFELINYAPCGTNVNNVLYRDTASQSHLDSLKERDEDSNKNQTFVKTVGVKSREGSNARKKKNRLADVGVVTMAAPESTSKVRCGCGNGAGRDLKINSEGTTILNHGALIKFGCISFVFSIVDNSTI